METQTTFLTCWHRLPEELQLNIMKYAVPISIREKPHFLQINERLFHRRFWNHSNWRSILSRRESYRETRLRVFPLLSVPGVKDLVLEALYSQNPCRIKATETTLWPPLNVHRHVKHLQIAFSTHSRRCITEILFGIARRAIGFGKLNLLELDFEQRDIGCLICQTLEIFKFPARVLEVQYLRTGCDEPEMLLLDKLTICGKEVEMDERWERAYTNKSSNYVKVKAWSDVVDGEMGWMARRRTTKTVWIRGACLEGM